MGMTSDQNENLSFEEAMEIERKEKEAKANKVKVEQHHFLMNVTYKGKKYQLLAGETDKKWYKAEYLYTDDRDFKNHGYKIDVYSEEVTPVTEEEFYSWFPRSQI